MGLNLVHHKTVMAISYTCLSHVYLFTWQAFCTVCEGQSLLEMLLKTARNVVEGHHCALPRPYLLPHDLALSISLQHLRHERTARMKGQGPRPRRTPPALRLPLSSHGLRTGSITAVFTSENPTLSLSTRNNPVKRSPDSFNANHTAGTGSQALIISRSKLAWLGTPQGSTQEHIAVFSNMSVNQIIKEKNWPNTKCNARINRTIMQPQDAKFFCSLKTSFHAKSFTGSLEYRFL